MAGSTIADLVGRVLAGRYRLLGAIGTGASGRVYVADDVRLRRRVAVKVLHAALAEDAGFLRRFRSEAQLAASLHHPNVMAVYDWGEDGVPFMVLELLSGGSLRSMLDAGTRLTPAQAAHIGGQVAAALDYSHSRGLVHRDIKPANLLFDEHGIVRVADFGLARALAEASWTEPAGTMLGTARYAAPEQATGAPLDGRADLYATGLVLVEAVTGTVPLVADSPLGTLGLRQTAAVDVPNALGVLKPSLERVCAAEPADRFATAEEFRAALADAAELLPPPGPLRLAGLGDVSEDPHPTQVARARVEPPLFDQDRASVSTPSRAASPVARAPQRSRSSAPMVLVAVIAIAVAGMAFVLTQPNAGPTTTMPLLIGETRFDAGQASFDAKLLPSFERRRADDPEGTVIGQEPAPGAFLSEGDTIRLTVSKGPRPVNLPALAGKNADEANAALGATFLVKIVPRSHEVIPAGQVIKTVPEGKAPPDTEVQVHISTGPKPVPVPDLASKSYNQAAAILKGVKLGASRVDEFNDTVKPDNVIRTDPAAGAVAPRDSVVTVFVSKGPDLVVVPDFVAKTIAEATALADATGVELQVSGIVGKNRKVRAQAPPVGTKVKRGEVVTVFF